METLLNWVSRAMDMLRELLLRMLVPEMMPVSIGVLVGMAALLLGTVLARSLRARAMLSQRVSAPGLGADAEGRSLGAKSRLQTEHVLARASRLVIPTERAALSEARKALINAGFFSPSAMPLFYTIRIVAALGLPILGILLVGLVPGLPSLAPLLAAAALAALGLVVPPVYLDWRRARMREVYRHTFPDFMDILVVCIEAGQSLQGAIERVAREIARSSPQLGANLHIVSLELRAGRDLNTALSGLADRLGIDEVKSLTLLLKQSEELGTSLAGSLRVYSDEMRDKRLMRAEAKANALPVKMVIPLGLCMFPVILVVTMLPLIVRIKNALV